MRKSFSPGRLVIILIISCLFYLHHPLEIIAQAAPQATPQSFGYQPLKECWHLTTDVLRNTDVASDNTNFLYLPLPEGIIKSINVKTRETLWQSEVGGEILGSLLLDRNNLYVLSLNGAGKISISALSSGTGITQWKKDLSIGSEASAAYILDASPLLFVMTGGGQVFLLDKVTGRITLEKPTSLQTAFSPVIKEGKIYIGTIGKKIMSLDLTNLTDKNFEVKEIKDLTNDPTALFINDKDLYVGDNLGKIYKINVQNKEIDWASRTGAGIISITEAENNLLVASSDNYVYLYSEKSGNRVWKKRFQGRTPGKFSVRSDIAVFSPLGEKSATVVELVKGKTINQITLDAASSNAFINSPNIVDNVVIFSTIQGYYAFASSGCALPENQPNKSAAEKQ